MSPQIPVATCGFIRVQALGNALSFPFDRLQAKTLKTDLDQRNKKLEEKSKLLELVL